MKLWHSHVTDIQIHPHNYLVRRQKPWERTEWAWSPLLMAGHAGSRIQALWASPVLSPPWQILFSSLSTLSWSWMTYRATCWPERYEGGYGALLTCGQLWFNPQYHICDPISSAPELISEHRMKNQSWTPLGIAPNQNANLAKEQPDKVKPD